MKIPWKRLLCAFTWHSWEYDYVFPWLKRCTYCGVGREMTNPGSYDDG